MNVNNNSAWGPDNDQNFQKRDCWEVPLAIGKNTTFGCSEHGCFAREAGSFFLFLDTRALGLPWGTARITVKGVPGSLSDVSGCNGLKTSSTNTCCFSIMCYILYLLLLGLYYKSYLKTMLLHQSK